ncbi:MAG TPA: glycoside hydrolase family 2 TIM barrel-domain containing protein [Bacillota bacterium]|nr:glycoside hydrolase family 2 TIM barrel-domain containing protein [Bacillota bacterium]
MTEPTNNFLANIHDNDYDRPYLEKLITHQSMIFDRNRDKESLDGHWSFGIDQYDTCIRAKWYEEQYRDPDGRELPVDFSFDQWEKTPVPSCWNLQQEQYFLYEGSCVYTRTFNYINHGEKRVFLKFGAVNYEAKIFLNQQYLGLHQGGSTPFYLEVTGYLRSFNRILVVANNTRKVTRVPNDNTDWFNYGGIYREVELIRLPETFIRDFRVNLVPGSNYRQIQVQLQVEGPGLDGEASFSIPELKLQAKITVQNGQGKTVIKAAPELWAPSHPKLYEVTLTYQDDSIKERIGFREIKVIGTNILLNGENVFLKGICYHEESVPNGKAISETEIIQNLKLAKELNCNYIRLAHYPHTEKAAVLADELGIMLWEEIPVYWAIEFDNPATYQDAENQLTELIWRDQNRASVIIWSVGNENADTDARYRFMSSLARKAKELDPTRLVSAACLVDHRELKIADRLADDLDVVGVNEYYGWYNPDFSQLIRLFENSQPAKPVIISEFGADARAGARGTADDLGTEDCQLAIYRKQLETLGKIPYVKGISPWILYDFRCPRRLHHLQNYYNIKGLLSADKKYAKPAFYVLQEFYRNR